MVYVEVLMKAFVDIESGGFKHGELMVMWGRQSGKSTLYDTFMQESLKIKFQTVGQSEVDGEPWYTVRTTDPIISSWIRRQDHKLRVETTVSYPNYFDIHEKLYIMLELKYK